MFGKSTWPAAAGYSLIVAVSIVVFAGAVQLLIASCPCSSLFDGNVGRHEATPILISPDQRNRLIVLGTATFTFLLTWVMMGHSQLLQKHHSVAIATRIGFTVAILYAFDPVLPSGALRLTVAWLAFYVTLTLTFQWSSGGAMIEWCGIQSRLSELLSAFAHNGGTMMFLLSLLLMHPPANWSEYLNASWDGVLQEGGGWRVPLHVFSSILACMLRDIVLCEAEVSVVSAGMMVHHFATIGGCMLSFASPMGVGAMTLNGLNLELGSATYSGLLLIPVDGHYSLCRKLAQKFYWFGMTASNLYGIYLALEWFAKLPISWTWPCMYSILGAALCFLRQTALVMNLTDSVRG